MCNKKLSKHNYLRDWIYGGIDGVVTTFAVVSGVVGASLEAYIIIILGLVNLIADGFSMAASNYLGTKSEEEQFARYQKLETERILASPQQARAAVTKIYAKKGVRGKALDEVVTAVTADQKLWVDTLLREHRGLPESIRSPMKAAVGTFVAFLLCGVVPLVPFIFAVASPFLWSSVSTALVFFIIGSVKSRWSITSWWHSGLMTLLVGAAAALLAYFTGYLIHVYFGIGM